ncbi:SDR family oxidoreductase [Pararobbsia silviterrae]|uniref:SDR family oxidoreductase n=1 Tax=Pararobbsia silviterrae TaxID=1792498 RepID=A0A494Y2P3_9BURK|nr:SDR family oxidoreductase [Pararobbsia silviterrae]RKP55733.1 SDR family oxidoreductase [Pararobbsia silviterrae]
MPDFSTTKAIVTGHTRGIGAAVASQLLERGVQVLGVSRGANPSLAQRFPGLFSQIEVDLADAVRVEVWIATSQIRTFVAHAECVALVNNAGTLGPVGGLDVQAPADIARAIQLNVATPMMLAAAFAQASAQIADRRIVHVSSGAARNAYAGWSLYCGSKAALDHHARAVALDAHRSIRICSLAPGVVDTQMQSEIRDTTLERFPDRQRFEALKRDAQLASPDDAARKIVDYLFSDTFGEVATEDVRTLRAY